MIHSAAFDVFHTVIEHILGSICQYWRYIQDFNAYLCFLDKTGFSGSSRISSLQNTSGLIYYEDGEMFVAVIEIVFQQSKGI